MSIQPVKDVSTQPVTKPKVPDMSIQPVKDVSIQPVKNVPESQRPTKPVYGEMPSMGITGYEGGAGGGGVVDEKNNTVSKEPKQDWLNPVTGTDPGNVTKPVDGQPGMGTQPVTNPSLNYLISLPGLSDGTKQALGNLINTGYQPSQAVTDALTELNRVISNQPAQFQSQYFDQLNNVMNQILGRESFSYDLASDPRYLQYKDQFMQAGRRAMQDAMGQAAAMTSGYGSSYASSVGNQAYQQHLTQLNEMAPELYQMAMQQYQMTGDQMQQQYNMLNNMYQTEYGQYQDQYDRWLAERDYYAGRYDSERNFDYGGYRDRMGDWKDIANWERDQYNVDRDFANADRDYYYNYAMQMIQAGKMPSQDLLDRLGLSSDDIRKLRKYYKNQNKGSISSGGGSGSKKGSNSSSDPSSAAPTADYGIPEGMTPEEYADYLVWLERTNRGGYNGNVPTTR